VISGILASCEVHEEPDQTTDIVYRQLENAHAGYNQPVAVDMDNDGDIEFGFTTALVAGQGVTHLQFRIHPVYGNQALVTQYDVTPLEKDSEIGPDALFRKLDLEALVIKTITDNSIVWNGPWEDGREAYIGVCFFRLGDLQHPGPERSYGWLRVSFNKNLEKVIVHDLAYSSIPEKGLKAGQKNSKIN